ncbi:MAG: hypothetical protein APR56_02205 [Methanosaeta sp. SDB]|nr:MAG: hypothetical protein APR56_02205 [Methanosaeta sp. SDB]
MQATTQTATKAAGLPDGLHHRRGVEYLAAAPGMEPDKIGAAVVFGVEIGFSEATGFFKESKGRGYWMTTLNECSCPSFMYRGGPCKHQKRLAEELQKRAAGPSLPAGVVPLSSEDLEARRRRIAERNAKRAEERARAPKPSTSPRGFNMPEVIA